MDHTIVVHTVVQLHMEEILVVDVNHIQHSLVVIPMHTDLTRLAGALLILQQVVVVGMEHVQYVRTMELKVVVLHIFIIHVV